MDDTILQVAHLSKRFGDHEVLRDIDFTVARGDVTSIIGASGSGKSTLLRCINLLETPSSGEIRYHGTDIQAKGGLSDSAYRARVGMVFQSFNLFENMSVLDNCTIGQCKVLKKNTAEARESALRYLDNREGSLYANRIAILDRGKPVVHPEMRHYELPALVLDALSTGAYCRTHACAFRDGALRVPREAHMTRYQRLMAHWHARHPGRILDVDYAQLTADPAGTMRRVAAFFGIAYQDAMSDPRSSTRAVATASALQVRSGVVRRDTPKWLPYAAHLRPMAEALARGAGAA